MNAKVSRQAISIQNLDNMPIQTALDNLLLGELEALTGYRKNWMA
jgi:hypothetical protein